MKQNGLTDRYRLEEPAERVAAAFVYFWAAWGLSPVGEHPLDHRYDPSSPMVKNHILLLRQVTRRKVRKLVREYFAGRELHDLALNLVTPRALADARRILLDSLKPGTELDNALVDLVDVVGPGTGELRVEHFDSWEPRIRRSYEQGLWSKEELPGLFFKAVKRRFGNLHVEELGLEVDGGWDGTWVNRPRASPGHPLVVRHLVLAGFCRALGWTAMPYMTGSTFKGSRNQPSSDQEAVHVYVEAVDAEADIAIFRSLPERSSSVIDACRRRLDAASTGLVGERANELRRFFLDLVLHHERGHVATDKRMAAMQGINEKAYSVCQADAAEMLANAHAARHLFGGSSYQPLEKWLLFFCPHDIVEMNSEPLPPEPFRYEELDILSTPSCQHLYSLRAVFEPDPAGWLEEQVEMMETKLAAISGEAEYGKWYLARAEQVRLELVERLARLVSGE